MGRSPPVPPACLASIERSSSWSPLSHPSPVRKSGPCDVTGRPNRSKRGERLGTHPDEPVSAVLSDSAVLSRQQTKVFRNQRSSCALCRDGLLPIRPSQRPGPDTIPAFNIRSAAPHLGDVTDPQSCFSIPPRLRG